MSFSRTLKISLSFVGLLVGAGFATGQEVVQYFISFGVWGIAGAVVAGVVMTLTGAVILQLGSYFLADEHNMVFRNVSHPVVSRILDISVSITLFAIGFVMFAGAGANLHQQYGLPTWIGAGIMLGLVMVTGLMNVDKVSQVISSVTPLIILAVIFAFAYTMFHLPENVSQLSDLAADQQSPVSPWLLSAFNYNGLALMLGVSMCLVIGGNHANPKEALLGGLSGGILYTVMLIMAAVTLLLNFDTVQNSKVPMLQLFASIHPILGHVMVWIIFLMIYNTAIGMFYALGQRLAVNKRNRYVPIFLITCLLGYAVSFLGFEKLMEVVYPILGYLGLFLVAVLVIWWVRSRGEIKEETSRRQRLFHLEYKRQHPQEQFGAEEKREVEKIAEESNVDNEELTDAVSSEVDPKA
ncbi:YkvI family membrane protein [Corynebacterium heidelbergense]|uniref:Membrane protein YkvI n=1 Tax=Corynebacterium heidelbergense TaxID=2055947 RepID=A0A364V7G4_9CORY|nr:hypothetical protein [Corynebacterium heidelbergense]RAV32582.1 hypothetical protein DLJ54_02760 [Corynebacterium heidelbergense]